MKTVVGVITECIKKNGLNEEFISKKTNIPKINLDLLSIYVKNSDDEEEDEGDLKYKLIVFNELYFVRQNQDKIERTAKNLYEAKKNQVKQAEGQKPLLKITLDFEQLESLCTNYRK